MNKILAFGATGPFAGLILPELAKRNAGLVNGTLELCAEGTLNRHEIAAMIGAVTGRTIEARRGGEAMLKRFPEVLWPMFEHYDHHGLRGNALTLRAILGREPRTLRTYFEELNRQTPLTRKEQLGEGENRRACRAGAPSWSTRQGRAAGNGGGSRPERPLGLRTGARGLCQAFSWLPH